MAVIVEDGSIVADANSYGTIAEATDYFTFERPGVTDWATFDAVTQEASLRFATRLLGEECWRGRRAQPAVQVLDWPRALVWDPDRERYISPDSIPDWLKWATFEWALSLAREDRTDATSGVGAGLGLQRVRIDVLELEWADRAVEIVEETKKLMPDVVKKFICPYILNCGMGIAVPVART